MTGFNKYCGLAALLCLVSVSLFGQSWSLKGEVNGISDGSWVYLRDGQSQVVLDSAAVKGGQFTLHGTLATAAQNVYLYTANFSDYVSFWLEPTAMQVQLTKGQFKQAVFTGSRTQQENDRLTGTLNVIRARADSLANLLETTTSDHEKESIGVALQQTEKDEKAAIVAFIRQYPHSLVAVNALSVCASIWERPLVRTLLKQLSPEMQNSPPGKDIERFLLLVQDIKVGGKFADFTQEDINGQKIRLSDVTRQHKYTLLEFWGSWCGPCRAENPRLVELYKNYHDKGFEIVGVAADYNKDIWLRAVKDDQLPWVNLCDLKGDKNQAALIYGINAYPTNFLIDAAGNIIEKDLRGKYLEEKLSVLLP